jgi:CBS domain-containing protein
VAERIVYVSRLERLPLLGADGTEVGRLSDVVLGSASGHTPPPVNGFVVALPRRRVFVGVNRVGELGADGARLRRGTLNVRQFELRDGEQLVLGQIVGRSVRGQRVVDLGLVPDPTGGWDVSTVALAGGGLLGRRRAREIVSWDQASDLFARSGGVGRQAAALGQLHPVEMASAIRGMPLHHRRALAEALVDERLADLLEELSEEEQVRIVEGLDLQRVARVLDEMEADDAADLLGELSGSRRAALLGAMDPEEAEPVRRLLSYGPDTAGGLMTPEPIIMTPNGTVAEALARIRDHEVPVAMAAQVFVCQPPTETPTGRYMGVVGFQRLLREAPSKPLGRCLDDQIDPISADASDRDVSRLLAAYDAVTVPVTDDAGRLVGAVTVDDVLDRLLPSDWRAHYREETDNGSSRPALDAPRAPRGDHSLRP